MNSLTFDRHLLIKRLREKGIPEAQAEAIINVVRDVKDYSLNDAATKADIRELDLRMDNKFKELQIKLGSMIIALGGVLIGIRYFG